MPTKISAARHERPPACTRFVPVLASTLTRSASTPVTTVTPSAASRATSRSASSGSSRGSARAPRWSTVTCTPSRASPWASSIEIGPPPIITRLVGARSSAKICSLVSGAAAASPSIGGSAGRLPVASSTKRAVCFTSPTRTLVGDVSRAAPASTSTPRARKRSALSSVAAICAWIAFSRAQTRAVSPRAANASRPYASAWAIVWAALAEASSALDGTQPVHRQSPPGRSRSATATLMPSWEANSAATMPAEPRPMMRRS